VTDTPTSHENPFRVFSPEYMTSRDVVDLFVVKSPGADSIKSDGHSMLVGSRGAGKSMLLRYLEPDCQVLLGTEHGNSRSVRNLPFYAAYVNIKGTETNRPALRALEGTHASLILNEHFLVISITLSVVERAVRNHHFNETSAPVDKSIAEECLFLLGSLKDDDLDIPIAGQILPSELDLLVYIRDFLKQKYTKTVDYLDSIIDIQRPPPFLLKLCRYTNLLVPFILILKRFPSMPTSSRFFLAIDDADQLSEEQTTILNTWLSRRNSDFSFKVAYEMYGYKTFYTSNEGRIESPHDYQEIKISDVYTSNRKTNYRDRLREIVRLRLLRSGLVRGKSLTLPPYLNPC
jgi:hypothetical protein